MRITAKLKIDSQDGNGVYEADVDSDRDTQVTDTATAVMLLEQRVGEIFSGE